MQCERCGEKEATVHITTIRDGQKQNLGLCSECAADEGYFAWSFEPQFPIHGLLGGLMDGMSSSGHRRQVKVPGSTQCSTCGRSYREFAQTGFLGCTDCYSEFHSAIEPLIKRMQGGTRHTGKRPESGQFTDQDEDKIETESEIERLRAELQRAVQEEEYERAAQLRDRIRELEANNDEE